MCSNRFGFQGVYAYALSKAGALWFESSIFLTAAPSSRGPSKTAARDFSRDTQVFTGCFPQQLPAVQHSRALQQLPMCLAPTQPLLHHKNYKKKEN